MSSSSFPISRELLRQILFEQHQRILAKSPGIVREKLTEIKEMMKLPHVIVITGMRRVGKSTVLRQIMKYECADSNFYYITFEDERLKDFPSAQFTLLYEILVELFGEQKTFFLDEVQNIEGYEWFIRRYCDDGFKFIITGSNANLLSSELGTKLTGRHIDLVLYPFSFKEYLQYNKIEIPAMADLLPESRALMIKNFEAYSRTGGMPENIIYQNPQILPQIFEDILIKDISVRYKVSDLRILRDLYLNLITNFSQPFSYNKLSDKLEIGSSNTVKNYITYLENCYFALIIPKFDYSVRKQISNEKKFYLVDIGFIPHLTRRPQEDRGWKLENIVCVLLSKDARVYYYHGKQGCDFVTIKENKVKQIIQVCYELTPENEAREFGGLIECMKVLKQDIGMLLTYNQFETREIEKKKIQVMPVWYWALTF
jgi:predicted AAA+ superfamily ATPase